MLLEQTGNNAKIIELEPRYRKTPGRWRQMAVAAVAGVMLVCAVGCSGAPLTTREKGTLAGGAIGAGSGALVGAAVGAPGAGAAIGGVAGAGAGYLIGNHIQNEEIQHDQAPY
ncbi:MAG TPA: YMGG-like glycine zipper-containing protein [Candidatus Binataceae bacterium]|nr:YMGG-like glycine zipper-containing protein [Candidatus Binataceae bacterium]